METTKKILAVLVMAMCIIGILLAFSGIVGSWVLNRTAVKAGDAFLLRADSTLAGLQSNLDTAQTGMSTAEQLLNQIEAIPLVGGLLAPLNENVDELNSRLDNMSGQVGELQGMVEVFQTSFHIWLNLATVFINIFLLWFGVSQVSLFYHARDYYRREEVIIADDTEQAEIESHDLTPES